MAAKKAIFGRIFTFIVLYIMRTLKWKLKRRILWHIYYIINYLKTHLLKFCQNKFQMVMINYSKLCASLLENPMSEFYVNWAKVKFKGSIQSYMSPWKLWNRQILPVNKNLSSVYFSLAKSQLVSCNLSFAMIWQMRYTHKLPKQYSATL